MKIYDEPLYHDLTETAYCVRKKDLAAAAKVMAAAFGNDGSIRYLLGGKAEGKNDWRYFLCVLKAVYGKCVMLSVDEELNGLLILFPPALKAVQTVPFMLNGGMGLCRYFGAGLYLRSLNYENNCRKVKKRYVTPESWYCMCFAVKPEQQGKGIGSLLFRPVLDITRTYNTPLYLETHKRINVEMYKHYGFDVVGISEIPGTNITQYSMLRR